MAGEGSNHDGTTVRENKSRVLIMGKSENDLADNAVYTSKYTLFSFLPIALREQFRRVANVYFLVMGGIMAIGYYTDAFDSAITPWTTLGPLAFVVSVSLLQEGFADLARHNADRVTNTYPVMVLRRYDPTEDRGSEVIRNDESGRASLNPLNDTMFRVTITTPVKSDSDDVGNTNTQTTTTEVVTLCTHTIQRMDIRAGDIVLCRNRDMVPVDLVLLASSAEGGSAYIETSSIDGETNLKLRLCSGWTSTTTSNNSTDVEAPAVHGGSETLPAAVQRVCQYSALVSPNGTPATDLVPASGPSAASEGDAADVSGDVTNGDTTLMDGRSSGFGFLQDSAINLGRSLMNITMAASNRSIQVEDADEAANSGGSYYVGVLTCEPPNASVNTFNGKLTLPEASPSVEEEMLGCTVPLGGENLLLRGAVLRNTEWILGMAAYTGSDTKLVQNSFATPSKFSRLDLLANKIIYCILVIMALQTATLAALALKSTNDALDDLWYIGILDEDSMYYSSTQGDNVTWPYLPGGSIRTKSNDDAEEFEAVDWTEGSDNFIQMWLLFITLLNNYVPLSLYVTLEVVTFCLMWYINNDLSMYHKKTDTAAMSRSTIVSDLGQVEYIFSDKTGTLTQNVMRFKRASVDGIIFGAPISKAEPVSNNNNNNLASKNTVERSPHLPLRSLLAGSDSSGLEGLGGADDSKKLTFNAEMFLRVLCICHTVVVEADYDTADIKQDVVPPEAKTAASASRKRLDTADAFDPDLTGVDGAPYGFAYQAESPDEGALVTGAATIFGFQLVSRSSAGVTLQTQCESILSDEKVTKDIKRGKLNSKELASRGATNRRRLTGDGGLRDKTNAVEAVTKNPQKETWSILCINKFDSERKRMSVLVRSPPELGSIPMILCKGADSAMLNPNVCKSEALIRPPEEADEGIIQRSKSSDTDYTAGDDWERGALLGVQSHLGEFASEGLRTLVLGVRILSEAETEEFTTMHAAAASAIVDREGKLKAAANAMESDLHIVGATAIEDKLQKGVPDTIARLAQAGIKLWVLTGDKRETAVEIGYSTKVLTPNMHLVVVKDGPVDKIKTKLAMEFIRLIKAGALPHYSKKAFEADNIEPDTCMGKMKQQWNQFLIYLSVFWKVVIKPMTTCWCKRSAMEEEEIVDEETVAMMEDPKKRRAAVRAAALTILRDYLKSEDGLEERRRTGRLPTSDGELVQVQLDVGIDGNIEAAESNMGGGDDNSNQPPVVFNRSSIAKQQIRQSLTEGRLSGTHGSISHLSSAGSIEQHIMTTTQSVKMETLTAASPPLVDEDALSLPSFAPDQNEDALKYDNSKRTVLERMFASDAEVRTGRLRKHYKTTTPTPIEALANVPVDHHRLLPSNSALQGTSGPRAFVIEGHALLPLLGDPILEEILFSVASQCDAVIACRVSPKQKALLVKMVRNYVSPEPVTLAIGDGANDVGMIQEAHVGIGISGLEGQQAVNASDFAIAQFRYLQDLLLIHGRWNFTRMSKVVMYSFYKNAVLVGILSVFAANTLYSGTPLFDQWVVSMLNFVAGFPILFLGIFDRDLEKDYVKAHPEVYASGPRNEDLSWRIILRWCIITFVHILTIYFLTGPCMWAAGGYTSAFHGLMKGESVVGDGEGGDLKVFGTVIFTILIFVLGFKVLYETRSVVIGVFPPCRPWKRRQSNVEDRNDDGNDGGEEEEDFETWSSRAAYTIIGLVFGSFAFYMVAIYIYDSIALSGGTDFIPFYGVSTHTFNLRSMTWILLPLTLAGAMGLDVAGKVFSNMFYPQQTQIHVEIQNLEKRGKPINGFSVTSVVVPGTGDDDDDE